MASHPHLTGDALREAVQDAARCRATRFHRMEMVPSDPGHRPLFGTLITYRCEVCGTIRRDIVQRRTGDILSRSYDPPEWYTAANESREDPSWWRAKWWESLPEDLFLDAPAAEAPPRRRRA
jgi:hypothetical protein